MSLPSPAPSERFGCPQCLSVFRAGFARCPLDGAALQGLTGDPLIGHLLAERYVIEELLGEGGMGRVYRARHMRMSRRFAVKVLFGDMAADAKARTRFSREAEAVSRLNHPNVLSVVDFGETEEGLLYLVMDYIEGRELHQLLAQEAPLATQRVLSLLRQLARGLAHAHERNLVHRDFKTENVVVTKSGDEELARIVDFGIAAVGEMTEPDQRLTTEGMVLGTPAYMSPEQSTGEAVDERSDLFSLGVMLYEMLCGRLPFDGNAVAIAKAHLAAEVPPIAVRVAGLRVDPRLEAVSKRLMAKDPSERFQTARALLAHLDAAFGRADSQSDGDERDATLQISDSGEGRALSIEELVVPFELTESAGSMRTKRVVDSRWLVTGAAVLITGLAVAIALYARSNGRLRRAAADQASSEAAGRLLAKAEPAARSAPAPLAPAAPEPARAELVPDPGEGAARAEPASTVEAEAPAPEPATAKAAPKRQPERARSQPARGRERDRERSRPRVTRAADREEGGSADPAPAAASSPAAAPATAPPAAAEPAPSPAPRAPAAPAAEPVVSRQEFVARYHQVGVKLDLLIGRRGEAAVAPLRKRYLDVPLQDALRSEAVRRDADRVLRGIATRVERALAESKGATGSP